MSLRIMLLGYTGKVSNLLRRFVKPSTVTIDNFAYLLHYRASSTILMACSLLVSGRQFFGDPIECESDSTMPNKMLETFCWMHSTFSVEGAWQKTASDDVPYPGVDTFTPNEFRVYHSYYQAVCFVFFLQAILFYLPHYLWKCHEGGILEGLLDDLTKKQEIPKVAVFLKESAGRRNGYFLFYLATEVLNLLNVIGQIGLTICFLGEDFATLGWDVLDYAGAEWSLGTLFQPMLKIFPTVTKCLFQDFGPSGVLQTRDAMCLLPLNDLNAKIYLFLWFWLFLLAGVSLIVFLFRLAILFMPPLRLSVALSRCPPLCRSELAKVIKGADCAVGDWFLYNLLAKNLDHDDFSKLVKAVSDLQ